MEINIDNYTELIEKHAQVAWTKIMKPVKYSLDDLIKEGALDKIKK